MAQIKLMLFDLDDTLVHFDDCWEQSLKEAFCRHETTRDLDAADHFNRFHQTLSLSFIKPDPATIDLLARWSRRYRLGIVTNGTASWQKGKLEASGLLPFFPPELIIISEETGFEKPAREIYQQALSAAQTAAEHALFVGDSWSNDVVGPGRLGIRAVWFNKRGEQPPSQSDHLAGAISRLEELEALL